MTSKIIAVSGTHGTGKSSLAFSIASFLKKLGKNVAVINELARECPFPINQDADDRSQAWIATKQITKELEKMNRYDYLIVDRSLMDPICYSTVLGNTNSISLLLMDYVAAHIRMYYKKVYILDPLFFNWNVVDGIRDNDETFRNNVHETMIHLFKENKLSYTLVRSSEEIYSDLVNL